jgi:phosphatidylserine decarboxylase
MKLALQLLKIFHQEDINFLVTNRIPRRLLTQFMGWFSKIEWAPVRWASIALWKQFADLRLHEAKKKHFNSLHDCFIRELKADARPIDHRSDVLTSPCDAILGAHGPIEGLQMIQAKGFPYTLFDLLGDPKLFVPYRDGTYATLRITSTMYHRFHAPHNCHVRHVTYISGDTWNVNPIALKRVEKLFCKNERAAIQVTLSDTGQPLLLVPVAAVLVASIRLRFLNVLLHLGYKGPNNIECDASFDKGEEMGWFQHGSTIIVLAPKGFHLYPGLSEGDTVRVGQPLMRLPSTALSLVYGAQSAAQNGDQNSVRR